jgi:surface protein
MFSSCYALRSVGDISNWDVRNLHVGICMFIGSGLTSLNISNWSLTHSPLAVSQLIDQMTLLETLDMSNTVTNENPVAGINEMGDIYMYNCPKLTTVYCNNAYILGKLIEWGFRDRTQEEIKGQLITTVTSLTEVQKAQITNKGWTIVHPETA